MTEVKYPFYIGDELPNHDHLETKGGLKMDEKICRECEYFTLRMGFHGGLYRCCAYTRGESTRLHELEECPRKWEPPEYIKRMSVERNNLMDKIKNLEDFLDDHEGIIIDMADSYLMHQQIKVMQQYVDILTTRIVHDTTKEKAKQNE